VISPDIKVLRGYPHYEIRENNHFTTQSITTPSVGMRVPCSGHRKKVFGILVARSGDDRTIPAGVPDLTGYAASRARFLKPLHPSLERITGVVATAMKRLAAGTD
jgi:hypothetical protein